MRANIGKVVVPSVVFAGWGFAPEAHYIVHDPTGKSVVIEYVDGKLNIHDDPLGVITNSPNFDWQMTNLRNYVNFSMINVPPIELGSVSSATRPGNGNARDAWRFHAALALRSRRRLQPVSTAIKDRTRCNLEAFHILNQFDIPKGSAREQRRTSTVTWSQIIRSGRRRSI